MSRDSIDQDDWQEEEESATEQVPEKEEDTVKVQKVLKFHGVRHFFQGINITVVAISIISWIICVVKRKFSLSYMIDKAVGNTLISGLAIWALEYYVMKFTGKHIMTDYSIFKRLFIAMFCYYFSKAMPDYNLVFGIVSFCIMVTLSALYHIERHHELGDLLDDWVVAIGPELR